MGIHGIKPSRAAVCEGHVDAVRCIRREWQPSGGINIEHRLRLGRVCIWRSRDIQALRMHLVGNSKWWEELTWMWGSINEGQRPVAGWWIGRRGRVWERRRWWAEMGMVILAANVVEARKIIFATSNRHTLPSELARLRTRPRCIPHTRKKGRRREATRWLGKQPQEQTAILCRGLVTENAATRRFIYVLVRSNPSSILHWTAYNSMLPVSFCSGRVRRTS